LLDLAGVADKLADLADVERVVVPFGFGFRVDYIGVFPCLKGSTVSKRRFCGFLLIQTYTREGTVVPKVAFVGKAVANEAKLAFFDVLLDRVEELFF
jgi:hypothetical protein